MALTMAAVAMFRQKLAQANAIDKWRDAVDTINPLEETFQKQRIRIADLVSPIDSTIQGKTFIDCELIGPANLVVKTTVKGKATIHDVSFLDSDFILVDQGKAYNAAALMDCTILRGRMYKVTLLVPRDIARVFQTGMNSTIPWLNR